MEKSGQAQKACGCRPMQLPSLPVRSQGPATSSEKELADSPKYYQEIGAEMIGNQLIIRVEKDKNRLSKRKGGEWDPPCDCAIPEIRRPSNNQGPKIVNAGDNNQILFRIRSRTLVGKDDTNYKPEAFAYQVFSHRFTVFHTTIQHIVRDKVCHENS
ncbi:uncharacterized protein [Venturia canescens]|uniref:uncharacterized protein n=1 Tax=Venturia canescens TaxID=32260 RepID=UPI001C9BDA7F|nr:uncharacterized protein LOC122406486 [Venturia canescens]